MNKLQMAQEYALKMLENLNPMQIDKPTRDGLAYECFELAEAMLAENDKRAVKLPDVFFDTKSSEEFQPDFSNTPKDAIAYKIVDGIVQYLHGTRSSDGTLCGGYLANDGWIKLEKRT